MTQLAVATSQVPEVRSHSGYRLIIEDGLFADDLGVVWGTVTDATVADGSETGAADIPAVFVCTFEEGQFRHDRMYADFTHLMAMFGRVA